MQQMSCRIFKKRPDHEVNVPDVTADGQICWQSVRYKNRAAAHVSGIKSIRLISEPGRSDGSTS